MAAQWSFDTLAFAKRLAAAGIQSRQAQTLAEALNDIVFDTLATKNDLRDLEHRLTVRMCAMITASMALSVGILGTLSILS